MKIKLLKIIIFSLLCLIQTTVLISQEKEKMWCLLMPEDEEQDAPGDAQESEEKNQVSLH